MSASYDYSTVADDFLLGDDRGYAGGGGGGGDNFWSMKAKTTLTVYFTTPGPWTKDLDHGWWSWREIFAQNGLTGVGDLPPGMKAFPVRDQETYRDADDVLRRRDIAPSDPAYDQLLALVVPYVNDRDKERGRKATRPVRDVVGVSVVELAPDGQLYPKVLTMTANRYRKMHETITSFRAMNPTEFTLMGFPWVFGFTGDTAAVELPILRPLPDQPPIDLPDPHDIPELLQGKRAQVYAFVQQATGVDTSAYSGAETAAVAEATAPAEAAAVPDAPAPADGVANGQVDEMVPPPPEPPADEPVGRAEIYGAMTETRLKTLLTKKGVSVRPKTPRDELIRMAVEHNV